LLAAKWWNSLDTDGHSIISKPAVSKPRDIGCGKKRNGAVDLYLSQLKLDHSYKIQRGMSAVFFAQHPSRSCPAKGY
jgi:hypothetical protein